MKLLLFSWGAGVSPSPGGEALDLDSGVSGVVSLEFLDLDSGSFRFVFREFGAFQRGGGDESKSR
jgi:hypothetical protein